jgi:hypothetical protein
MRGVVASLDAELNGEEKLSNRSDGSVKPEAREKRPVEKNKSNQ